MVSGEEILKSMRAQMEEYKKQFDAVSKEIDRIGVEYQTKIDELQQERIRLVNEGNAKLEELKAKREQISGMHSALFQQCNQYEKLEDDKSADTVKKKSSKPQKVEKAVKQEETLTEDDLAKLKEIVKPEPAQDVQKSAPKLPAEKDIPDYLKDSYK